MIILGRRAEIIDNSKLLDLLASMGSYILLMAEAERRRDELLICDMVFFRFELLYALADFIILAILAQTVEQ